MPLTPLAHQSSLRHFGGLRPVEPGPASGPSLGEGVARFAELPAELPGRLPAQKLGAFWVPWPFGILVVGLVFFFFFFF